MDLAVFTSLKAREGRNGEIQSRSLDNWQTVFCLADFVEFDGPLVPFAEMVTDVEHDSEADVFIYANADILFDKEQIHALYNSLCRKHPHEIQGDFLMTGQRIDILADGSMRLHRPSGMDYFVFRRGMFRDLPRVLMGRGYCDSAIVAYCLRRGIPVIDASFALRVKHQFHDYGHVKGGQNVAYQGVEALENKRNNSLVDFGPNCLDATHTLLPDGRVVPNVRKRPGCWRLWHLLTRGGKYWKNPKWEGVAGI